MHICGYVEVIELAIVALVAVTVLQEEPTVPPVLGMITRQVKIPASLEPDKVVESAARAVPVALLERHVAERVVYQYTGGVCYTILC